MKRQTILHNPDSGGEGGQNPPAAELVTKSNLTEEDAAELARLRLEKQDTEKARKAEQTRLSELEDENRRLKTPPALPKDVEGKSWKERLAWLNGY